MINVFNSQVKYSKLTEQDEGDVVELLSHTFCHSDPLEIALNITQKEFKSKVRSQMPVALSHGLSIVARSLATKQILGVSFVKDARTEKPMDVDQTSKKFLPIGSFIQGLTADYLKDKQIQFGEGIHLFMLGVHPQYEGQNIGKSLVKKTLSNAKSQGYNFLYTTATNNISQHIFRSLAFVECCQRSYKTFQYDGEYVFSSITEHSGSILMEKHFG